MAFTSLCDTATNRQLRSHSTVPRYHLLPAFAGHNVALNHTTHVRLCEYARHCDNVVRKLNVLGLGCSCHLGPKPASTAITNLTCV